MINTESLRQFLISLVLATVLTGASYLVALWAHWIVTVSWTEAAGVFTSYSCTYLCVKQSRWNYPIGAISVLLLCVLFFQLELFSSMALQIYLFPTLAYGYWRWGPDEDTRPVTHLKLNWWLAGYAALTAAVYLALLWFATVLGASMAMWDAVILVGSILAQFMMDNKKIENWIVWIVVDLISIYTYFESGAFVLALQMLFFLGNAVWAYAAWEVSRRRAGKVTYA